MSSHAPLHKAHRKDTPPTHNAPSADALVVNEINEQLKKANDWFADLASELKNKPADKDWQQFMDGLGIIASNSGFQIRAGNLLRHSRVNVELKRREVGSLNTVVRDAEYYLFARWKASIRETGNSSTQLSTKSKKPETVQAITSFAWLLLAPPAWDGIKGSLQGLTALFRQFSLDEAADAVDKFRRDKMQSNNQPNSPPGGFVWALKGLRHGTNEDGYAYVSEIPLLVLNSGD